MFMYSPFLTLIVLLSIPLYIAISVVISPTLRNLLEEGVPIRDMRTIIEALADSDDPVPSNTTGE